MIILSQIGLTLLIFGQKSDQNETLRYILVMLQIIVRVAIKAERPRMDADCPDGLRRLIQKCWHQDAHLRPSCAEIVRLADIMMQQDLRRPTR